MVTAAPLVKSTEDGKVMVRLLANLGRELARELADAMAKYHQASGLGLADRQRLAEIHYLRLEQLRRVEKIITPAATLKRNYLDSDLSCLKIVWSNEQGGNKSKTVPPSFDCELSKCLLRGDSLAQILYTAETGKRTFSADPETHKKGMIPQWVREWEEKNYSLKFIPPDFADWVKIKLD